MALLTPDQVTAAQNEMAFIQQVLAGQNPRGDDGKVYSRPHNSGTIAKWQTRYATLQNQLAQNQASTYVDQQIGMANRLADAGIAGQNRLIDASVSAQNQMVGMAQNWYKQQQALYQQLMPQIQAAASAIVQYATQQGATAEQARNLAAQYAKEKFRQAGLTDQFIQGYEAQKPGELTPVAQQQYSKDLNAINDVYGAQNRAGLRMLAQRGMGQAPTGALASLINTNARQRGEAETEAYRTGQANSEDQRKQAAQMRLQLAQLFDPTAMYQLSTNATNAAGALQSEAANTQESLMNLLNAQGAPISATGEGLKTGLAGLGDAYRLGLSGLGGASGAYGSAASNISGMANNLLQSNLTGAAQERALEPRKTGLGGILSTIGSVAAAPLTGGVSLAGLLGGGLSKLFGGSNDQYAKTNVPQFSWSF